MAADVADVARPARAGERRGGTVSEHDMRLVLRLAKRVGAPEVRVGRMTMVLVRDVAEALTNLLLRLRRPGARRQRLLGLSSLRDPRASTSPTPPPASRAGTACPFGALKTVIVVASVLVTAVTAVTISTVTSMMPPTPSSVVMMMASALTTLTPTPTSTLTNSIVTTKIFFVLTDSRSSLRSLTPDLLAQWRASSNNALLFLV